MARSHSTPRELSTCTIRRACGSLALTLALASGCADEASELRGGEATGDMGRPAAAAPDIDAGLVSGPSSHAPDGRTPLADAARGPDVGASDAAPAEPRFAMRVVTEGLDAPWEITWGPDGQLWISERAGRRVVRVDPQSGARKTALRIDEAHQSSGQDGLLGLALHPRLLRGSGEDHVFVAHTYDAEPGPTLVRRAKIVRYTYDPASGLLSAARELLSDLPASNDHNSGRLVYGPDDTLYYTIGDQGKNQFDHKCEAIRAQDLPTREDVARGDHATYEGKILRLGLDGAVPSDNPVIAGVRSHVYTYGHRNAQGLAFAPDGTLYASEHGPKTDDELNRIEAGKNYGWPHVAGERDDRGYVYGNWSAARGAGCATLGFDEYTLPDVVPSARESAWSHPDLRAPLATFYTVDSGYDFRACAGSAYLCWPTIAPSSLELYPAHPRGISGWGSSLLVPSLKEGRVVRVPIASDGTLQTSAMDSLFETVNRYRDLTIAPDLQTFYVVTDSSGETSGPTQRGGSQALAHRGAVLEFRLAP